MGPTVPSRAATIPTMMVFIPTPNPVVTMVWSSVFKLLVSVLHTERHSVYAQRKCEEYAKLGLMGITVLYGSGDSGVAGDGAWCLNPDGKDFSLDVLPVDYLTMSFRVRKPPMGRSSTPHSPELVHMSHLLALR